MGQTESHGNSSEESHDGHKNNSGKKPKRRQVFTPPEEGKFCTSCAETIPRLTSRVGLKAEGHGSKKEEKKTLAKIPCILHAPKKTLRLMKEADSRVSVPAKQFIDPNNGKTIALLFCVQPANFLPSLRVVPAEGFS